MRFPLPWISEKPMIIESVIVRVNKNHVTPAVNGNRTPED